MSSKSTPTTAYIQDVAYHSSFNPVQAPAAMSFVAASQGFEAPDPGRPFSYLELGCGTGTTLNGLAAACPHGQFTGVDFNAGLISAAREAARAAGLGNIRYVEAAFSSLETRGPGLDLGQCDYLACSGTWSWLDDAEKMALRRVIDATLRTGGLFYLGYASIGRHSITPMWQVLRRLVPASDSSSVERLRTGIQLLLALRDQGAQFLVDHPPLLGVLNAIEAQVAAGDRSGLENLAHNALAEAYRTELVDEVAAGLGPMGIGFCGTAELFLNDPDLCVPNALRSQFDQLATRVQQELFKDFLRSTLARRDIFIRDVQRAPGAGQAYLEERAQATLTLPRAAALEQVSKPGWTAFRYATPEIEFVFERLADGATRLHEIAEDSVHAPADLCDAFCKLVACPGIEPCLRAPVEAPVRTPLQIRPASPFNQLALQASRAGTASIHLASPVLGSCIELPHAEAMLLAGLCGFGTTSAGPEAAAGFRRWFMAERLPQLMRLGTVATSVTDHRGDGSP